MAKGNWDALSSGYRTRLERNGISRSDYESGTTSLSAARGHKATPERPERAETDKEKYRDYRNRQDRLIKEIIRRKDAMFSNKKTFNKQRSDKAVRFNGDGGRRGIKNLRTILAAFEIAEADNLDYYEMIEMDSELEDALRYH